MPSFGDPAATVDLAERAIAQDSPVGRQRLPEDLLAMRNEQQRQVAMPVDELPVIERSDDGLACPGRSNHEISVTVVPLALDRERVQHSLLVWVRPHVKAGEGDRRGLPERAAVEFPQRLLQLFAVDVRVVGLEVL